MNICNLSIIIPIYNAEKTIERCVSSCIVDNMRQDYEILLIDDGSVDSTSKLCQNFINTNIRYISKRNTGVSDTRNLGLSLARGEYVCFLDADDELIIEAIIDGVQWAKDNELDIVQFGYRELKKKKNIVKYLQDSREMGNSSHTLINLNYVWGKIIRREYIYNSNILFNTEMPIAEDYLFIMQIVANAKTGLYNALGYIYDNRGNGSSKKYVPNLRYCNDQIIQAALSLKHFDSDESMNEERKMLGIYSGIREIENMFKLDCPYLEKARKNSVREIIQNRFENIPFNAGIKYVKGIKNAAIFSMVKFNNYFFLKCFMKAYTKIKFKWA